MGRTQSNLMWLTPRANEPTEKPGMVAARLGDRSAHCHGSLSGQVADPKQNWPTPDYSDRRSKNSKQQGLSNKATGNTAGKKLNPAWVEQLMGIPVTHTQLSGATDPNENRTDRLRLCGNGVVRATAVKALTTLLGRLKDS